VGIAGYLWFILHHCQLLRLHNVCDRILLNEYLERIWKMAVTAQFEYHPGTLLDDAKKIKRKRNEQL